MALDYTYDRMKAVDLLKQHVDSDRFSHCLGVEKTAVQLARHYGADEAKAGLAGLLHDIMKQSPDFEKLGIRYGLSSPSSKTMHGPIGASWLHEHGYVDDEDVLNAIRYHTTGRAAMGQLEKIVYLADITEPGRKGYIDVERARELVWDDLDEAMLFVLSASISEVVRKGHAIDPRTVEAYNYYCHANAYRKKDSGTNSSKI